MGTFLGLGNCSTRRHAHSSTPVLGPLARRIRATPGELAGEPYHLDGLVLSPGVPGAILLNC
jgi:hypothetical protein